ncbi:hypothetical protein F8388_002304 [Cannabis sativa]|uniref:ADP-ribosylation factor-like protein 5 n=3 Tax=Cannabis sativa TaxID=3483 RepID=A0A7J6H283_CANSA|nr:hypothetical protein F8388_002304 [Cannabis sativa]KAF4389273.1 hypothetical protein G4B88_003086 [Cannabis sativa]
MGESNNGGGRCGDYRFRQRLNIFFGSCGSGQVCEAKQKCKWRAREVESVVVNMDAGIDVGADCCSTGSVVRNHIRNVIASQGILMNKPFSPIDAEFLTIKHGIELARLLSLEQCSIVSDCNMAVAMLGRPPKLCGEWDLIICDIRKLLDENGWKSSSNGCLCYSGGQAYPFITLVREWWKSPRRKPWWISCQQFNTWEIKMGAFVSKFWFMLFPAKEYKLVVVGLDNAGKTTTLYKLHLGEVVTTHPTVGSNVEELVYKNIRFEVWDLGGQDRLRTSWATYYRGTHSIIVVIDSTDRARISIMKDELFRLLGHDDLQNSVLLVFANKQDLKDAMTPAEITDALSLHSIKNHDWHIQACSALTGDGLYDGLGWIAQRVTGKATS